MLTIKHEVGSHRTAYPPAHDASGIYVDDGQLPVDNNWIENQIRPIAIGRNNWLFAGSLRAGQRAAAVMSLIQSARMRVPTGLIT